MAFFRNQPLFVILFWIVPAAMLFPVFYAVFLEDWLVARTFFYHAFFFATVTSLVSIATYGRRFHSTPGEYLLTIFGFILLAPLMLAAPVDYLVDTIHFGDAYFEMLSSLTTTGATIFDRPEAISPVIHFWRGLCAWLGGLLILVVAFSIFEPLNIGGFEVFAVIKPGGKKLTQVGMRPDFHSTLWRDFGRIAPIYALVTGMLTVAILSTGERVLVATMHAMGTISTSGITPLDDFSNAASGRLGEFFVFLFLLFAITRHSMHWYDQDGTVEAAKKDKEINLMLMIVICLPVLLFLRHYVGAWDVNAQEDSAGALSAFWGSTFTTLSFLTTTGYQSGDWAEAQNWSGLKTPAIILMGLVLIGGGIATTAGGIKLLRVYALYKHGLREMQRLSFPHSVAGSGTKARAIRREGAYVAWVFFMLYLVSLGVSMMLLSIVGLSFEEAATFATAALSTTGPLVNMIPEVDITYAELPSGARAILGATIIIGRLETLAVLGLLAPSFWRR